jgi:hypothetical protein
MEAPWEGYLQAAVEMMELPSPSPIGTMHSGPSFDCVLTTVPTATAATSSAG